jgi:small subunit ribosomal protein S20
MPVLKNAIKALRRDRRRTEINQVIRSQVRTILQKVQKQPVAETVTTAFSVIDRAAKKGVLHKNKASRLKSKISKTLSATAAK